MAAGAISLVEVLFMGCALAVSMRFLTTPKTPESISHLIADLFPRAEYVTAFQDLEAEALVLDYSYDEVVSHYEQSERTVVMWRSQEASYLQNIASQAKLTDYLQRLNFTQVVLIADTEGSRLELCHRLLDTFPSVYAEVIAIPNHTDPKFASDLVRRVLKPSGNNLFALFTDENSAWSLLQAFEKNRLMKAGFSFVLCVSAVYFQQFGPAADGLLYVAPAVSALARSQAEAERTKLAAVAQWSEGRDPALPSLLTALDESPVLVNVQRGRPTILTLCSAEGVEVLLPGNQTAVSRRQKGVIPVSVQYEPPRPGHYVNASPRVVIRGVQIAFEEKNNGTKLFPMFQIVDRSLSLGKLWVDYNFTREAVRESRDSLGLIHFPFPAGGVLRSVFEVLRELDVSLPMCMSVGGSALSSPKDYPLFLRPRTNELYTAKVFATVFRYFGWKRAAVLYSRDSGDNEDTYKALLNYSKEFNISFTNSETSRALTDSPYSGVTKQLNTSLQEIIDSDARILVVFYDLLAIVVNALYDLGVRSRFLIVYFVGFPISELTKEESRNLSAVVKGALQISPRTFIGKTGQKVREEMIAKDGDNYFPASCFFYDAAMLYMHATDYLIRMGHDYEDPYEIVKAMRSTHFAGCSGTITIAPGLNDKSEAEYSIMNFKYFERNNTVVLEDAMYYNPFSVVLFKAVSTFMWPDNSTVFTDTFISTFDCPFLEAEVRHYSTGMIIGVAVSGGICAATLVITTFIWKKWWNKRYPVLCGKTELSADDLFQMVAIPIEFFQLAAVGPESHQISHTLSQIMKTTTLQLEEVLSATGNTYWHLVKSALACVCIYAFLCVVKLTNFERKLEWIPLWSFLMLFANLALPVLSNLLFLPIISILSKLFLCYHTIGDHLTSSFMNKDCYTFCWTGAHLTYVICGSVALALYIPLGVYAKPMWQEAQEQLHIRAQPLSLMVKSVVQVILLTLSNSLKQDNKDAHSALFFTLIAGYFVFKLRYPQYNYPR